MIEYECNACIMECSNGASCGWHEITGTRYEGMIQDSDIGIWNVNTVIQLCEKHYNKHAVNKSKFTAFKN